MSKRKLNAVVESNLLHFVAFPYNHHPKIVKLVFIINAISYYVYLSVKINVFPFDKIFISIIIDYFSMVKTPNPSIQSSKVTERIYAKAFELLEKHPEGLRWSELLSNIKASDPTFHPKTVNGCVWKLVEKFPDRIYKPSKGLFRLLKYK